MKIGIYGGSFNPPHLGHQNAAVEAAEKCALDKLLLIPAGIPPHKVMEQGSPANEHRLAMTRLMGGQAALQSGVEVEVLDLEMAREGKSYTVDTLRALRRQYPNDELLLFMGTDMFFSFESWRAPEEIAKLAKIVAFYRNESDTAAAFAAQAERLRARFGGSFETLALDRVIEVSSTALRAGMASGTSEAMLEPQVYGYILREHLYGTNLDLKRLTVQQLRPIALSYLKGEVSGFVRMGIDKDLPATCGVIDTMYVKPALQGRGYSEQLFGYAAHELRYVDMTHIAVRCGCSAEEQRVVDRFVFEKMKGHPAYQCLYLFCPPCPYPILA